MQSNGKNPVDPNGETHVVFKHPYIEYLYIQKCMYWELIKGHEKKALWSIKWVHDFIRNEFILQRKY